MKPETEAWLGNLLMCGACLRIRFSPIHGVARLIGFCPGDK